MTERTYLGLYDEASAALAAGCTVIADAVFASPEERAAIRALAARHGVPFTGLWLEAPTAVLAGRVDGRRGDVSDADLAVVRMQAGYDLGRDRLGADRLVGRRRGHAGRGAGRLETAGGRSGGAMSPAFPFRGRPAMMVAIGVTGG